VHVIDVCGSFGLEMETFEFLNLLQVGVVMLYLLCYIYVIYQCDWYCSLEYAAMCMSLMIDGSFGLEMETFEFLNLLQVGLLFKCIM
jgi:hypothetical protein